jgi:hypothetical protein
LDVQDLDLSFPEIERITDVEQFLLSPQLKLTYSLAKEAPLVTVELLPMHANDEAQVVLLTEHTQEHVMEFSDLYFIGNREHSCHNRADVV